MEVAVLAHERGAERGHQSLRVAAGGEVRRRQLAGLVDLLLAVEQLRQLRQQRFRVGGRLRLRQPRRRDVQEAVEVDARGGVEHAAQRARATASGAAPARRRWRT